MFSNTKPCPASPSRRALLRPSPTNTSLMSDEGGHGWEGCSMCCGLCRCCTCLRLGFLTSPTGIFKMGEVVTSFTSQMLLLKYGVNYGPDLGLGYYLMMTTSSSSILSSLVLLLCYLFSTSAYNRIRPSLFEVVFNLVSCCFYLGASTCLATAVVRQLYYYYHTVPNFSAYPALTAVYILGYTTGILHGVDSLMAFRMMRKQG